MEPQTSLDEAFKIVCHATLERIVNTNKLLHANRPTEVELDEYEEDFKTEDIEGLRKYLENNAYNLPYEKALMVYKIILERGDKQIKHILKQNFKILREDLDFNKESQELLSSLLRYDFKTERVWLSNYIKTREEIPKKAVHL